MQPKVPTEKDAKADVCMHGCQRSFVVVPWTFRHLRVPAIRCLYNGRVYNGEIVRPDPGDLAKLVVKSLELVVGI